MCSVVGSAQMSSILFSFETNTNGIYYTRSPPTELLKCGVPVPPSRSWKKKKWRGFASRRLRVLNSGGVVEKDFQFKPSFDHYLKTLESVRENKQKQQPFKSNSKDDLRSRMSNQQKLKGKGAAAVVPTRNRKAMLVNGDDDFKAETDAYRKFEQPNDVARRPQVSTKKLPTYSPRYDSSSKPHENVKMIKFVEPSEQVKTPKLVKYNAAVNARTPSPGVKRPTSRKAFLQQGKDEELEIERAAFNNFQQSNEIVGKARVSKMEMEERIQTLAKSLNGADIDMPEWMFSKMMRSAKIKFSDYCILRVIQILGKLGNWRRVLQVIDWLEMRERFKSYRLRHIYTTALNVLGKARRPVEALNLFRSMQQQMASYPDIVAYHSIAVTLGQAGHMRELFDVIDSMRSPPKKKFKTGPLVKWDPRLEPDIVVYNAVLNACAKRKQWEGAFWVLQQLKQQHLPPSTTTYGLVMEVMFACEKYNLVHEFFRKIEKSSIPNALTYRVLVNTLWKEGKTDEAVLAVQGMEKRGIVGSAALYYDLARCLCSAGRCQEALMQIEKICKVANKPLVVTYTGLIQACLDSGNIENGAYIFNQMQNFCSPNLVTCNIMLKAYLDHGLFDEAKLLFSKMSENANEISSNSDYLQGVIADSYTFNIMLDACVQEKRLDEFERIYGRMLRSGFHFNAKRHLRMILDAARAGKVEALERTWEHMVRADRTLPLPLIKERFCMKLEQNDYISALSCITGRGLSELGAVSTSAWLDLFKKNASRLEQGTIVGLVNEVESILGRSESVDPVLDTLLTSCKEFLTYAAAADINLTQSVCKVEPTLCTK